MHVSGRRRLALVAVAVTSAVLMSGCGGAADLLPGSDVKTPGATGTAPTPGGGSSATPGGSDAPPGVTPPASKSATPKQGSLGVKPYVDNWSRHAIDSGPNEGPAADLTIKANGTAQSITYLAASCGSASEPRRCGYVEKLDVQVIKGDGLVPFSTYPATSPTPEMLKLTVKGKTYFSAQSGDRITITKQQFLELTGQTETDQQPPTDIVTGYFKVTRLRAGLMGVIPPDESAIVTHYCSEGVAEADRPKCFMNG